MKLYLLFALSLSAGCGSMVIQPPTASQPMYNITSETKVNPVASPVSGEAGASIRSAAITGESDPQKVCHERVMFDNSRVLICETVK